MKKHYFTYTIILVLITMVHSSCAGKKGPEHYYFGNYSEAEALYNKGEYEQAILKYEEYMEENPEGNLAVISEYYIAKSKLALGQVEEAKAMFERIARDYPDLVWANFSETQLQELSVS